jgi:hypothetical protein
MANNSGVSNMQGIRQIRQITGIIPKIATNTTTTVQADCNISTVPDNHIINISNYMYDEQTILYINYGQQNYTPGVYYDPTTVTSGWNYSVNSTTSLAAGNVALMSIYKEDIQSFQNLNTFNGRPDGIYNLDILNRPQTTTDTNGLFYAIGGNYTSQGNQFNTVPNYSQSNTSNYLMCAQYIFVAQQSILIISINITIVDTNSLNVLNNTGSRPQLFMKVINKVMNKESIQNNGAGAKIYEHSVPLSYSDSQTFDNTEPCFKMNQPIPIVFATGFNSVYAFISVLYVPPVQIIVDDKPSWVGEYLPGTPGTDTTGFLFVNGSNTYVPQKITKSSQRTTYGHFVIGFAYQDGDSKSTYLTGGVQQEVLTTNIWRSPISLYNSYKNYSIADTNGMSTTLLFGKTYNGALFLVTNSGTPISCITAFGYTSLSNFIIITQAFYRKYDNTSSLVDYFTDPNQIAILNSQGYSASIVVLHSIIDVGNKIQTPSTANSLPNMNYLITHLSNSANITIDPSQQTVINRDTGQNYFGRSNSVLYSLGSNTYTSSKIELFSTLNGTLFANSIYLGIQTINNSTYNISLILPESAFRPDYSSINANILNIYATINTPYYVTNSGGYTKFVPGAIQTNVPNQSKYDISKLTMTVSNNNIF